MIDWEQEKLIAQSTMVDDLPVCRGDHNIAVCGSNKCKGLALCVDDCDGCPRGCDGIHAASLCGNVGCRGRRFCVSSCKGCPRGCSGNHNCTNTECQGKYFCHWSCKLCVRFGGCDGQHSAAQCGNNPMCAGKLYCHPTCTACPSKKQIAQIALLKQHEEESKKISEANANSPENCNFYSFIFFCQF